MLAKESAGVLKVNKQGHISDEYNSPINPKSDLNLFTDPKDSDTLEKKEIEILV